MQKLVKYNDGMHDSDIWFWIDSEDTLSSPVFETKEEAILWAVSKGHKVEEI